MSTKIWIWPHDGTMSGASCLHACDVDEMHLLHSEGMTLGDVKQSALEAYERILNDGFEPAKYYADQIKGAWIVPDPQGNFWECVGAIGSASRCSDSGDYTVAEAIKRFVDAVALPMPAHLGEYPTDLEGR